MAYVMVTYGGCNLRTFLFHLVSHCCVPCLQEQLVRMLRWASELATDPADSAASWDLLARMVVGRKELTEEVAGESWDES